VNVLDPQTRTIRVRLQPVEVPEWLLAGSAVDVVFDVTRGDERSLRVPRDAVVVGAAGARRVVRVVDGKASLLPVEVLAQSSERALILGDGISVGDEVVVRGNERLRPDQAVEVVSDGEDG